ncbi:LysR family transcriptional regulator [Paenibacillus oralis]|uniref:LysR family transcriptional regulator n=1 Tax=Paenibacillus oralis TaxID=2490856 RepID=A0A3P3U9W1_9BACL|nr:LysR family transcriptional regulator [Paenibacillus oralis]RRJ67142.1 LysR family transcriptional regulator [Paenibacillus oralis]
MEIKQLEYFMAVCEEMHFTRAAEKLGIAQPTLSLQIRSLETELNTLLFDRIGKRIALTEAGSILYRQGKQLLQNLQNTFTEIHELREMQGGHLSVSVLPAELDYRITPLFIQFHKQYPKVHLKIYSSVEIYKQVLDHEIDLGITALRTPDERLVTIPLSQEEYVLVVSENHELADREAIPLAELKQIPMVMYPKGFTGRELVEDWCRKAGFELNTIVEAGSGLSTFTFVRENVGATVMPLPLVLSVKDPALRCIPITDAPPIREIGMIYRADRYLGFAAREFMKMARATLKTTNQRL